MRKRLKGLLALWMALLIAVLMPITAYAATTADVYYYNGTAALNDGVQVSEQELASLTEEFKVDTSLYNQFSNKIPVGYNLTGWKLWKSTSGFYVSDAYELQPNGSISAAAFENHFTPSDEGSNEDIRYAIVEPLLELSYKITHQPTNAEPYVSVNEEGVVSTYEWYSVETYSVVDSSVSDNQISAVEQVGTYDATLDTWSSDAENRCYITLDLQAGDILQMIPVGGAVDNLEIYCNLESFSPDENGIYSGMVSSEDFVELDLKGTDTFSVQIKVIRDVISTIEESSGQDASVFSGPNGTYFCKVTFTNGASLNSETFTYARYDITGTLSDGGSFKCQVGGADVEKTAPGDTVTIVATPDTGYEPDSITVTKTDADSYEEVTVTDGSFTMPDYPVTVSVTFKRLTYVVTLPQNTVGYLAESTQTSPVEHGSDYTFTVTINDGYVASENFTVNANNTVLTATGVNGNVYTYTVQNVTEAQVITVTGVAEKHDITKSEATNGSYTVTAGGVEVTEAIQGTRISIKANPSEGYELDVVTVTKTGDSNTKVTVTGGSFTMPDYPITVSVTFKKLTYAVTLPTKTAGYTVESTQTSPVEYGSDYTFTVTLKEGYVTTDEFTVKSNNTALTATSVNGKVSTYTIRNVMEAQDIAVVGVKDGTVPVVKITLDKNNWWQSFLNKITFGLLFKEKKSLTIDATDAESGIRAVEYYLTDTDLFPEDKEYTAEDIENGISGWKEYTDSISLSEDKKYVLYAKATDQAGNVSYASTTGIVVDTMAPVISGIKDGETYYGDISFTVSDDYLKSVSIDGVQVQPDGNLYIITADNKLHTVVAEDQLGNSISYEINVDETWARDGIASGGVYYLKAGVGFKVGSGKWKVAGDDTTYEGGNTFYVQESGNFEFQQQ